MENVLMTMEFYLIDASGYSGDYPGPTGVKCVQIFHNKYKPVNNPKIITYRGKIKEPFPSIIKSNIKNNYENGKAIKLPQLFQYEEYLN